MTTPRRPRCPSRLAPPVALLVAALMALGASAAFAQDTWGGPDKQGHLIGGALLGYGVTVVSQRRAWGFGAGCLAGLAKELYDRGRTGFSAKDLTVTCAGALVGSLAGGWVIAATRMPYPTDGSHVAPLDADTDATTRTGPSQPAKACTSARVYVRPFPMSLVGAVVVVRSARSPSPPPHAAMQPSSNRAIGARFMGGTVAEACARVHRRRPKGDRA